MTVRLSAGIAATASFTSLSSASSLSGVGGGVGLVGVAAGRIGRAEGVGDVLHIDLRIGDRLEGVRVDVAVVMPSASCGRPAFGGLGFLGELRLELERRHALGQFDDGRLGAAGLDQALQKAFEMQAVDQHDIGLGHRRRVGRARLVDMRVAVRADQRGERRRGRRRHSSRSRR